MSNEKKDDILNQKSGYSIYSKQAEKRLKINKLDELFPKFPSEKYEIIYADPPWDYGGKLQFDKTSKPKFNINFEKNIFISSASFVYPTLKIRDLMNLKINDIAADDCLLFLWTTSPHLEQAIELGNSWGFKYKTVAFVWDKMIHNPGQYTLSQCELCLVFKKGRIPTPRGARNIRQLIRVSRTKHSQKPKEVIENITKMFPTQKKLNYLQEKKQKIEIIGG